MDDNMMEEKKILKDKKALIEEELADKKRNISDINSKLKGLRKESKGRYSEEKETTEKIYEVLTRDITSFEEALSAPYFGRVDFREYKGQDDNIYIGKKGISSNKDGEEVVVDWRAPVADLYYSGTGGEAYYKAPSGIVEGKLELKRKFLFRDGDIHEIFDEGINELMINGEEGIELVDEFLKVNLEESRGKKLKEVVATIQKEQNEIIRWPKNLPIIVQGSAGSGKTTVALHRLAYLIYRYRDTITSEEILVLAPNKIFLDYISDILPSLGASEVNQNTFEELVISKLKIKGKIYNKDEKLIDLIKEKDKDKKKLMINSSKVKGTLIYKQMLNRYISLLEGKALDIKDIMIEDRVLFEKKEIMRLYLKDLRSYPINKRKDEIKRYLNLKIKEVTAQVLFNIDLEFDKSINKVKSDNEDSQDRRKILINIYNERDKIKDKIRLNVKKEFNKYFKEWRDVASKDLLYNFFNDEELFEEATDGIIPGPLYKYMKSEYNYNYINGIIDEDDLASFAYIRILLEGIEENERFKHIVVDEAQDYSPFQIYIINNFTKGNSLTLVGDLAQGIYYYKGLRRWEDITEGLFSGNATYIELTQSYRSTVEIIEFAEKTLKAQELGLKESKPVLRHGEKPKIVSLGSEEEYANAIDKIIKTIREKGKNSVAIITKDKEEAKALSKRLSENSKYTFELISGKEKAIKSEQIIIPSYLTKGLEFDCTIILNPTEDKYSLNMLDKRLLYVALTRALHYEYVVKVEATTSLI